ncbi:MAG: leucine--tRNA ligase, partial [Candidatus Andersenbacteria bacterium]|nr:leucine--tRNA ligase [Candidatus Andersenbacteria bacterium]
ALLEARNPKHEIRNKKEVERYVHEAEHKTDLMRQEEEKGKTGVELQGIVAINPANGEEIPVWVADYVLMSYGTGAIMAVPAHDERDFAFAQQYGLPVRRVIAGGELPYVGEGVLVDSGEFTGLPSAEARAALTAKVGGAKKVMYKLRDWVFSRQRYWGEPIPIIHCQQCGPVAVPEKDLPVELPAVDRFAPTGTGESPLAAMTGWVNVVCPSCSSAGKRETNTMPQWAGSSWYYLRYIDPANDKALVLAEAEREWMPVDMYVGGAEHATRHLIYARFWHKFLYDISVVHTEEPFLHLQSVGLILGPDGHKMSKRWGNVVNPDDVVARYGADALRVYEMFMGPFGNAMPWSEKSLVGAARWLRRVWKRFVDHPALRQAESTSAAQRGERAIVMHRTIKRVTEAMAQFRFNTGIAALMEWLNELERRPAVDRQTASVYVRLLAPYAPHLSQELWCVLGHDAFVVDAAWPAYDAALLEQALVILPVQVNGRVRGQVCLAADAPQAEVEAAARALPNVARHVQQAPVRQVVYVPGKVINIVL